MWKINSSKPNQHIVKIPEITLCMLQYVLYIHFSADKQVAILQGNYHLASHGIYYHKLA